MGHKSQAFAGNLDNTSERTSPESCMARRRRLGPAGDVVMLLDLLGSLASASIMSRYESTAIRRLQETITMLGDHISAILPKMLVASRSRLAGSVHCSNSTLPVVLSGSTKRNPDWMSARRFSGGNSRIVESTMEMLQRIVEKPSPATFSAACLMYSLTTLIFHQHHKHDRYQNRILLVSVVLGAVWAIISSAMGDGNILGVMTFCIWLSLSFSATAHRIARFVDRQRHKDKEINGKMKVEMHR